MYNQQDRGLATSFFAGAALDLWTALYSCSVFLIKYWVFCCTMQLENIRLQHQAKCR